MPQKFLKAKQQSEAFVVMRCKLPTWVAEPTEICNEVFPPSEIKSTRGPPFSPKNPHAFLFLLSLTLKY